MGLLRSAPLDFLHDARPNGEMNTSENKLDIARAALREESQTLLDSSVATADNRTPVQLDQQSVGRLSRMDALQVQAMAQAVEGRRQQRLRLIEAALKRIDEGEYGYCVSCGDDIPEKRLAFDPAATRCVDCAQ